MIEITGEGFWAECNDEGSDPDVGPQEGIDVVIVQTGKVTPLAFAIGAADDLRFVLRAMVLPELTTGSATVVAVSEKFAAADEFQVTAVGGVSEGQVPEVTVLVGTASSPGSSSTGATRWWWGLGGVVIGALAGAGLTMRVRHDAWGSERE